MAYKPGSMNLTPTGIAIGAEVANVSLDGAAATDAFAFPKGNTAQRPPGKPGYIRYNSDLGNWEGYTVAWVPLGSGAVTIQYNNVTVNVTTKIDFSNGNNVLMNVIDDYANSRVIVHLDSMGGNGSGSGFLPNVYANSTLVLQNANSNYINTATINVLITAQDSQNVNIALNANTTAIAGPAYDTANMAIIIGEAAYAEANAAYADAQGANGAAQTALTVAESAYGQANAAYGQANLAYGQANLAYGEANTANALAQSAYTQANVAYADAQGANVAAQTALSVAESAYGQANAAYGQANLAYGQANAAYGQANLAYNEANTANQQANNAYAQANLAYVEANTANQQANNAYAQANLAYIEANTANQQANNAYAQANLAYVEANTANQQANNAYAQANLAYAEANTANALALTALVEANSAANTVATFANGSLILADANLNFNNTSTINVAAAVNGTTQTNVAFNANVTAIAGPAYGQANLAYAQANAAYNAANAAANTVEVYANGSLILANANLNFNNTAIANIIVSANGTTQANINVTINTANDIVWSGNDTFTQPFTMANTPDPNAPVNGNIILNAESAGGGIGSGYANITQLQITNEQDQAQYIGYETHMLVFNPSGTSIAIGAVCYISGSIISGNKTIPNVALAQANSITTLPAVGIAQYIIAANSFGIIHVQGEVTGLTIPFATPGQPVYVSGSIAGGTQQGAPALEGYFQQSIGVVIQSGVGSAAIQASFAPIFLTGGSGGPANTVATYANGSLILAGANLNFNNTATVNVQLTANVTGQVNLAFQANSSALIASGNTSNIAITYEANGQAQIDSQALQTAVFDNSFTASANQSIFTLSGNVSSVNYVLVFVNGVRQPPNYYTITSNNILTLSSNTSPIGGDIVDVWGVVTSGNLTGGGQTTLVTQANVLLGVCPGAQTVSSLYTYFTVTGIANRGMASNITFQANTAGLLDIIVSGNANNNTTGNGTTWWLATDITANVFSDPTVWYYASDYHDSGMYIGVRNRSSQNISLNLSFFRLERFA